MDVGIYGDGDKFLESSRRVGIVVVSFDHVIFL